MKMFFFCFLVRKGSPKKHLSHFVQGENMCSHHTLSFPCSLLSVVLDTMTRLQFFIAILFIVIKKSQSCVVQDGGSGDNTYTYVCPDYGYKIKIGTNNPEMTVDCYECGTEYECVRSGESNPIFANGKVLEKSVSNVTIACLLYTSPSPRDRQKSRMPSSA